MFILKIGIQKVPKLLDTQGALTACIVMYSDENEMRDEAHSILQYLVIGLQYTRFADEAHFKLQCLVIYQMCRTQNRSVQIYYLIIT